MIKNSNGYHMIPWEFKSLFKKFPILRHKGVVTFSLPASPYSLCTISRTLLRWSSWSNVISTGCRQILMTLRETELNGMVKFKGKSTSSSSDQSSFVELLSAYQNSTITQENFSNFSTYEPFPKSYSVAWFKVHQAHHL